MRPISNSRNIEEIVDKYKITPSQAKAVFRAFSKAIIAEILEKGEIRVPYLGMFYTRQRKVHGAAVPRAIAEVLLVTATVRFKPASTLLDELKEKDPRIAGKVGVRSMLKPGRPSAMSKWGRRKKSPIKTLRPTTTEETEKQEEVGWPVSKELIRED